MIFIVFEQIFNIRNIFFLLMRSDFRITFHRRFVLHKCAGISKNSLARIVRTRTQKMYAQKKREAK